jgi:hypothetical protein
MTKKKPKPQLVLNKLQTLQVNESFSKKEFVKELWGDYNYFLDRTFQVAFVAAKKMVPELQFKTISGLITRTL